jgi:hypothetical protein
MRAIVIRKYGGPEELVPACLPEPARVFDFDEIQDAHRLLESGEANGKLVVTI